MKKINMLMNIYNGEKNVCEQIESILAQKGGELKYHDEKADYYSLVNMDDV
ncbi:MAG: hypothetical protein K2N51_04615 [Lachnospiraceae bacterium]|nr:hypothetical protein [Lachnospiraceae bacterium]